MSLTVLIDARNVLRSRWPNIPEDELVRLIGEWAAEEGVEPEIVFDGRAPEGGIGTGGESADDWLIREAPGYPDAWLVTSDRALRDAAGTRASKVVGGGSFPRQLGQ